METLNNSGETIHPCLVSDLRRKAFSFALVDMILAVGCHKLCHKLCGGMFLIYPLC